MELRNDPLTAHTLAYPVGAWGIFLGRKVRVKGNVGLVQEQDRITGKIIPTQIPALFVEWMSDQGMYQAVQILTFTDFEPEDTNGKTAFGNPVKK